MLKVGVVGCGYWGPNLIRNLIEANRCHEVLCFDRSPHAQAKLLRRFPSVTPARNLEDLIDRCDAVMVATPVATHYSIAKAVLQRGKPVFVEKPLTNSSVHARELVGLADETQNILMVGHTFVYSPPVRKIKDYIDAGTIGDIYFIGSSRVNLGLHRNDINVIWDLAAHDLAILFYWLGEMPIRIAAMGRACVGALVDVASIHCEFLSGVIATLQVSWLSPSKLRRTVIVGSQRMAVYDDTLSTERIKLFDRGVHVKEPESFGEYQLTYRTGDILSPNLDATEPLLIQTKHFLDCVESNRQPETNGMVGLDVVLALEAACQSMENGGNFVPLAPPSIAPRQLAKESAPLTRTEPFYEQQEDLAYLEQWRNGR